MKVVRLLINGRWIMTRKDSERDAERPRYYSQFWLDVAAGRRVIGAPRTDEETEEVEPEVEEAVILRKPGRNSMPIVTDVDGHRETHTHIEPVIIPEEIAEPEPELVDEVTNDVDDLDIPNILVEEAIVPDMDLTPEAVDVAEAEDEPETETEFYDEEEEEEEEDSDWNLRGRKKPKPSRPIKLPTKSPPKKTGKRDSRRSGF